MTNNYFEAKVKYQKNDEQTGKEKTVSESFLVDAMSFTECEARITHEANQMVSGEFSVMSITRSKIEEFHDFGGQLNFVSIIEYADTDDNGKAKKSKSKILVSADNIDDAKDSINAMMKDVIVPWKIFSLKESNIISVFNYESDNEDDQVQE